MPVDKILKPVLKDLGGGFIVRRLLPAVQQRAVGPFIFFDHFGPLMSQPGDNHDVRPHPHIGLSTVTYLFEGAMMHRDSLGTVQRIEPGAINWMTAGSGIVHSERAPDDLRQVAYAMHGLQLWCALPADMEECAPCFVHTPADAIPVVTGPGYTARVMIGTMLGATSPVNAPSPTLYVDVHLDAGASFTLPAGSGERAIYAPKHALVVDGAPVEANILAVLTPDADAVVSSETDAHFVIVGGEPLGPRHMEWNFVSTRKDRIAQAKADWQAQRMGQVPGETEWIPLPG